MKKAIYLLLALIFLTSCGLGSDQSLTSSDVSFTPSESDVVVSGGGKITNLETFTQFLEGTEKQIRIVSYTVEGDPILKEVEYNGEEFTATTDTTRDDYGKGEIKTITCSSIDTEMIEKDRALYTLADCKPPSKDSLWSHLLVVPN